MKPIVLLCLLMLTACDAMFGEPPTLTPTSDLKPSPTVNPLPPTPIAGDFSDQVVPGISNPTAAAAPNNSIVLPDASPLPQLRPELVTISTADGGQLNGELYLPVNTDLRTTGMLLLSTHFDAWGGFPVVLRDAGFVVLSVEIRIPALAGDFNAMVDYLSTHPTVDPERIGVIGAESGADEAFIGCARDGRCKASILLTPINRSVLLNTVDAYNTRPLLIAASENEPETAQTAQALRLSAGGETIYQSFPEAGRGTQMLTTQPDLTGIIIEWIRLRL